MRIYSQHRYRYVPYCWPNFATLTIPKPINICPLLLYLLDFKPDFQCHYMISVKVKMLKSYRWLFKIHLCLWTCWDFPVPSWELTVCKQRNTCKTVILPFPKKQTLLIMISILLHTLYRKPKGTLPLFMIPSQGNNQVSQSKPPQSCCTSHVSTGIYICHQSSSSQ